MAKAKLVKWTQFSEFPDVLRFENGERVKTAQDWAARREEIYRMTVDLQYGGMPPEPEFLTVEPLFVSGRISSYRIHTGRRDKEITFIMQIVMPAKRQTKYPAVIDGDGCFPYVYLEDSLKPFQEYGALFVRFNRTELAHDMPGETPHTDGLYSLYPDGKFGAIAAWAWGYHRCVDALLQLELVDPSMIVFTGHSRGGKTALLAGITDTRATIVNPNGSGGSGAGCYRIFATTQCEDGVERVSERLEDLMTRFPFWLSQDMKPFMGREGELPFDQHMLKALVAPRILLDTEALSDAWANPYGTYVTYGLAKEVYKLLGVEENMLIHFRDGFHFHTGKDFQILLNVMRHFRDGDPLDENMNKPPFEEVPAAE